MDKYRKLTKEELATYGIKTKQNTAHKNFADNVVKHFGPNTARILVGFNSEYNDENYVLHGFSYVEVYDKNDNIMTPLKTMIDSWRKVLSSGTGSYELAGKSGEYNDPPDDLIIFIGESIPDLYVKE